MSGMLPSATLTARQVEERGLVVNGKSEVETTDAVVSTNPVTGTETRRPVKTVRWKRDGTEQVFRPDPGWGHAPDASPLDKAV